MTEFKPFAKMARLSREIIITEKIDGTNAQVFIEPISKELVGNDFVLMTKEMPDPESPGGVNPSYVLAMYAGSRTRLLTRKTDNFGFAKWVQEHAKELWTLGEGQHFGEWWGSGVQRGYGLPKGEKRFSLFNTGRWFDQHTFHPGTPCTDKMEQAPACCHVVPVLHHGSFNTDAIQHVLWNLNTTGSMASPGFMKPEGIVIYHTAANVYFKKTIEKDESPKSLA